MGTFASDERGVSEVLGAILVFGLVLTLLAIVQVQGVPAANERVELKHSEDVQEDLGSLQGAISRTAVTGSGESVRVDVGLRYPSRFVLINPPPATGSLRTEESKELELDNIEASDEETAEYLDSGSSDLEFETRSIVYEPGYNRLDDAGKTVFETGVRYKQFGEGSVSVQDRGALVNGRTISLITIDGELGESAAGSTTLSTRPLSTSHQVVTVTNKQSGNPLTLRIPTDLSAETWRNEVLADEYDPGGSEPDKYVKSIKCPTNGPDEPCEGEMVIELKEKVRGEQVTYNLRMAEIGVGQDATEPEPHYVTAVEGDGVNVPVGKSQKLTAQVRDRHNNPVSGVTVTFRDDESGDKVGEATTDENGHATITFAPSGDETVTASAGDLDDSGDIEPREEAKFSLQYGSAGPVVLTDSELRIAAQEVVLDLENEGGEPLKVTDVQLNYITLNQEFTKTITDSETGASVGTITVTQLVDGPNEIKSTEIDPDTDRAESVTVRAEEGKQPEQFTKDVEIAEKSGAKATFTFDDDINVGGSNEFAMVSITIYFEGGLSETYSLHLGLDN